MNADSGAVQVSKGELLQALGVLSTLLRDYEAMLERVREHGAIDEETERRLRSHHARSRAGETPFALAGPLAVLLAYVLGRVERERLTFRMPVHSEVLPAEEHGPLSELSSVLGQLQPSLEGLIGGISELAQSRATSLSHPRVEMLLVSVASLCKAIVRQDWSDVELVMNHVNMVTTSRESHELVQRVAAIVRNIYDSLNEVAQEYPTESLSQSTQEIPDAVQKIHSVTAQLEETANRNLDVLEVLISEANQDRRRIDEALGVLEACERELETLAGQYPHVADDLGRVRETLGQDVGAPLRAQRETVQANLELYMDLFGQQSYQDLTGQTLGKVIAFIESLQYQLIQVITKDASQAETQEAAGEPAQSSKELGPDASNRLSQDKVDALLADMGF